MKYETIYVVRTEGDCEAKSMREIGYATGDPADILAFYDDQKMYGIDLEEIKVVKVDPQAVNDRRALLEEKLEIKKRLQTIEGVLSP